MFCLVACDFGVEHIGKDHATHLADALNLHSEITEDWTGEKHLGIDLKWDYQKRTVHLSMKHCAKELLIEHNHPVPKKPFHTLNTNKIPTHGAKIRCADAPNGSPELNEVETRKIQAIIGSSLHYGRAVCNKLLVALSTIVMKMHSHTACTLQEVHHLLNHVDTHLDDGMLFLSSKMQLSAHSDARHLN